MSIIIKVFATGFGSGYAPIASGTVGSFVGILLFGSLFIFWTNNLSGLFSFQLLLLFLIVLFFVPGVWASKKLEKKWGKDPSQIVIDEIVGQWVALLFIPFSISNLILSFFLFRVFDIWKPLGIRKLENLPHGWGIMSDDVLAGIYANLVLQLLLIFV